MLFDFPRCLRDTAALNAGNLSKTRKVHLGRELRTDTYTPLPEPAAAHLVVLVARHPGGLSG